MIACSKAPYVELSYMKKHRLYLCISCVFLMYGAFLQYSILVIITSTSALKKPFKFASYQGSASRGMDTCRRINVICSYNWTPENYTFNFNLRCSTTKVADYSR